MPNTSLVTQVDCLPGSSAQNFRYEQFDGDCCDVTEKRRRLFGLGLSEAEEDLGITVDPLLAMSVPSIKRCVTLISDTIARVPLCVHRVLPSGGSAPDVNHAAYHLVRHRANRYMSAFVWKRTAELQAQIFGNHVTWIRRDNDGNPIELVPLDPRGVGMWLDESTQRRMYITRVKGFEHQRATGGLKKIFPDNVLHFKGSSMDGFWGLPVMEMIAGSLGVAVAARRFGARFFGKGSKPSGTLNLPAGMGEEEAEDFIEEFRVQYEGLSNSQRVLVFSDPDVEFKPIEYNNQQSQFIETRQNEDRQIATFFGFPANTVGVPDANSYNSLEMSQQAELNAIEPHMCEMEAECREKLLRRSERDAETHRTVFDREQIKHVSHKEMVDADVMKLNNGGMSVNEFRRKYDLPTSEDEEADKLRMPRNIGYIDQEPDNTGSDVPPPVADDDTGSDDDDNADGSDIGTTNRELAEVVLADITRREVYRVLSKCERMVKNASDFCNLIDSELARLCADLEVNISPAATLAGWEPDKIAGRFVLDLARRLGEISEIGGLSYEQIHAKAKAVIGEFQSPDFVNQLLRETEQ